MGVTQDAHSPSVWGLPAMQLYPMQTLLTTRDLQLPQRAVHHSVFHFTGQDTQWASGAGLSPSLRRVWLSLPCPAPEAEQGLVSWVRLVSSVTRPQTREEESSPFKLIEACLMASQMLYPGECSM